MAEASGEVRVPFEALQAEAAQSYLRLTRGEGRLLMHVLVTANHEFEGEWACAMEVPMSEHVSGGYSARTVERMRSNITQLWWIVGKDFASGGVGAHIKPVA
jgi:hypothetical protein